MALSFNHSTKRIGVPQADAQPLTMQALINAIRDEEASDRGIAYDQIADAAGKDDLGGGVMTGITVNLRSTWMIEFAAGSYQAAISDGNLADAMQRIVNTGSPQVLVLSSAAATVIYGEGGGTAPTAAQNAAATVAALEATMIPVNTIKLNGASVIGNGSESDPWRGVGVSV